MTLEIGGHKYYKPEEIAEIMHVTKTTAQRWIREGRLKAVKHGGAPRISEAHLVEFLDTPAKVKPKPFRVWMGQKEYWLEKPYREWDKDDPDTYCLCVYGGKFKWVSEADEGETDYGSYVCQKCGGRVVTYNNDYGLTGTGVNIRLKGKELERSMQKHHAEQKALHGE